MTEHTPHVCPLCGAPRAEDGTPSCACGRRVSAAHRHSRTAAAAAAEDFDPVRIRPFVELEDEGDSADSTTPVAVTAVDDILTPTANTPDASTPPEDDTPATPFPSVAEPVAPRRRVGLLFAGAAVAVLAVGGTVGGLLYEGPSHDTSRSDGIRAPLPDPGTSTSTAAVRPSASASSASPSPTPSESAGATPSRTATPTDPAPTEGTPSATASATPSPSASSGQPPVLRLGDTGPEVVELQLRLRQVGLYSQDADGVYDSDVQSAVRSYQFTRLILQDESGVYGRATRASLESETKKP
ncbi:peptidoglycan-binding domain-containing protein [Streptomyces griseorubiginosus]|uniref:peptidoglycan-binding domain-containing protein n=1 Tax=Streptomyces griseorubiginosus TaxID=67304 RepID=UPI0027E2DBF2|nr:peptidoglycan-binding domain-containing protein [Streptomyces griseorubiginosus]